MSEAQATKRGFRRPRSSSSEEHIPARTSLTSQSTRFWTIPKYWENRNTYYRNDPVKYDFKESRIISLLVTYMSRTLRGLDAVRQVVYGMTRRKSINASTFCPFGRSKIAHSTHVSGAMAGNWEKFSTSNKRTSAKPHWSRYRHCAKLTEL
jgi:hypothetical protein